MTVTQEHVLFATSPITLLQYHQSSPQSPGILTSRRHSDQAADEVGDLEEGADEGDSLGGREQHMNKEARFNEQLT
jgi:hypothetical protein